MIYKSSALGIIFFLHHDISTRTVYTLYIISQPLTSLPKRLSSQLSELKMKGLIKFLALATGLTVSYAAAVPSPAPAFSDIKDVIVKHYPDGLPDGLYPGPGLTSRATNLVKRGPVGVYICHDLNFSGDCVYVTSDINQCGE